MSNQIRNVLERPKVRTAIVNEVSSFWQEDSQGVHRHEKNQFDGHQQEIWTESLRRRAVKKIESVWHEHIASELDLPAALTIRDFSNAVELMFLRTTVDPQVAYESFMDFLASASEVHHCSRPIPVVIGPFDLELNDWGLSHERLWVNKRGFEVTTIGTLPIHDIWLSRFDLACRFPGVGFWGQNALYVRIEGRCTFESFRRFRREVSQVLRSIFRSWFLIMKVGERTTRAPKELQGTIPAENTRMVEGADVAPLLSAYFSNPIKKDSFNRRIRNALHLLVQSDQQRHTAIGIALSVAAIESLLCRNGGDLTLTFAENTAALLEPDPRHRDAAETFAKKLYEARSKVLHGELLEHEAAKRRNARALAGAVLQAIMERQTFQQRAGVKSETPDDLINELRRGRWVPGQLTGVSESPVRTLWGAEYEGPPPETDNESTDQESESNE